MTTETKWYSVDIIGHTQNTVRAVQINAKGLEALVDDWFREHPIILVLEGDNQICIPPRAYMLHSRPRGGAPHNVVKSVNGVPYE